MWLDFFQKVVIFMHLLDEDALTNRGKVFKVMKKYSGKGVLSSITISFSYIIGAQKYKIFHK